MSNKSLVEVDSRIAKIQREVADGRGSQIAQVEMCELLNERAKLLTTILTSASSAVASFDSASSNNSGM